MTGAPKVGVLIVTHDSAEDLPACFAALAAVEHRPLEVIVVDCDSGDGSPDAARRGLAESDLPGEVVELGENRGFAGGMNAALERTDAPFVLSLNADALPTVDFVGVLLQGLLDHPRAAAATGRLRRPGDPPRLDACGMRLISAWRHLDRGSGEADVGQFSEAQEVFGATGAATLLRRAALDDVAVDGEVYDRAFHSFREDAELCFRFQERGWRVLYLPAASAVHRRFNLPQRRSRMPAAVNYHSLKNRYLLRAYHQTAGNFLRTLVPSAFRDLLAVGYVLLRERSSLAAYGWLWRHRKEIRRRRRSIQGRRTAPPQQVERWFRTDGEPLADRAPRAPTP